MLNSLLLLSAASPRDQLFNSTEMSVSGFRVKICIFGFSYNLALIAVVSGAEGDQNVYLMCLRDELAHGVYTFCFICTR